MASPATMPPVPPGDQTAKVLGTFIALDILAAAAILLRFVSRWISRTKIWADDYCSLGMLLFFVASLIVDGTNVANGLGKHVGAVAPASLLVFVQSNYAGEIVYPLSLSFIKSTILCMYLRIFGVSSTFRKITYGLLTLVALWGVSTTLVAALQCQPIAAAYNPVLAAQGAKCINLPAYFLSTSIINVLIDACILVLPMRPLWGLKLATNRKLTISFIFLLGTFTTAISIVRTVAVFTLTEADPTWDLVPLALYSTLEIDTGIICACMPAMAPLLQSCLDGRRAKSSQTYGTPTKRTHVSQQDTSFSRLRDDHSDRSAHVESGRRGIKDLEMDHIYVTDDIEVRNHATPFAGGRITKGSGERRM